MITKTLLFCLAWFLMIVLNITSAKDMVVESEKNSQTVLFQQERLFIQANEVSLNDLLGAVAKRTNIVITTYVELDQLVTIDIPGYSIDEALKSILHDHSYVYISANSPVLWVLPQDDNRGAATSSNAWNDPLEPIDTATSLQLQILSDNPEEREDALRDLVKNDLHNAVSSLTSALFDPDHRVRETAIVTLTLVGGSEAVDALSIALTDQDPRIRETAVDALCELGDETAIAVLQQALQDEVSFVRQAAIEALDELHE
jgi:HEAT repeat protein